MSSTPDSDIVPTITYLDPLVMPEFIRTNNWYSIDIQCNGDWLLSSFITKLNMEIVDDVKEWESKKEIVLNIFDTTRKHGWAVYQAYEDGDKVFGPDNFDSWITELNKATNKLEKIGINVHWIDELGNTFNDALYFAPLIESTTVTEESEEPTNTVEESNKPEESTEPKQYINIKHKPAHNKVTKTVLIGEAYLFVWRKGNGKLLRFCPKDSNWAIGDVDLSVLSLAIQIRQIQNTLTFAAMNPFFYHIVYGESISPAQRKTIISQIGYTAVSRGIGAKKSAVDEIRVVENGSIEKCNAALDKLISFFAATTRLPLSFYFGEKQIGSGLDSGKAEENEDKRILNKKEYILQHFAEQLTDIATNVWHIPLPDLYHFYQSKRDEQKKKIEQDKKDKLDVLKNTPNTTVESE